MRPVRSTRCPDRPIRIFYSWAAFWWDFHRRSHLSLPPPPGPLRRSPSGAIERGQPTTDEIRRVYLCKTRSAPDTRSAGRIATEKSTRNRDNNWRGALKRMDNFRPVQLDLLSMMAREFRDVYSLWQRTLTLLCLTQGISELIVD